MSYDPSSLDQLISLIEMDYDVRCEYALRKTTQKSCSMFCDACGKTWCNYGKPSLQMSPSWRGLCLECGQPNAIFGFHGSDLAKHQWHEWNLWSSGRIMWEPHIDVVHALFQYNYRMPDFPYKNTRPLYNHRKLVERLEDDGFTVILREPVQRDRPLSMDARYDESFLWRVGVPGLRSWNMFNFAQYREAWAKIASLIFERNSCGDGSAALSPGSLETEYFKQLKTECYKIKLGNRAEGEGAFKLLSYLRSTSTQAIAG